MGAKRPSHGAVESFGDEGLMILTRGEPANRHGGFAGVCVVPDKIGLGKDPLELAPLFGGGGRGSEWVGCSKLLH